MGNDVVIYCSVNRDMIGKGSHLYAGLEYCDDVNGYPLVRLDKIMREFGGYAGHRLWKTANWIGDLMWALRGISEGEYPYIEAVYVGGDCSGFLVEATEEVVLEIVSKFIRGGGLFGGFFLSLD